jgi:parallel beta-helix repeat protein
LNNIISNNPAGIWIDGENNTISNNLLDGNMQGISLKDVGNSNIVDNQISNNQNGLFINNSTLNNILNNKFMNNPTQVYISVLRFQIILTMGPLVTFGATTQAPIYLTEQAKLIGSDGIADQPYTIDSNNIDNYPIVTSANLINDNFAYTTQGLTATLTLLPKNPQAPMQHTNGHSVTDK